MRTFNDWSQDGYKIKKGSKHIAKNSKGECLFGSHQVTKREKPLYLSSGHWDSATDENCCGGPMHGIYGNCD